MKRIEFIHWNYVKIEHIVWCSGIKTNIFELNEFHVNSECVRLLCRIVFPRWTRHRRNDRANGREEMLNENKLRSKEPISVSETHWPQATNRLVDIFVPFESIPPLLHQAGACSGSSLFVNWSPIYLPVVNHWSFHVNLHLSLYACEYFSFFLCCDEVEDDRSTIARKHF